MGPTILPKKIRWTTGAPKSEGSQPGLLLRDFEETRAARSNSLTEARTYASMLFLRPGQAFKLGADIMIYSPEGLRELGFNSMAEACFGALAQVARPLKSKVVPVGGTWKQKRTCEGMGQLIDGNHAASGFNAIAAKLTLDCMWAPEGFAVWEDDGKSNQRCYRLDPLESFMSSDRKEFVTRRSIQRREVLAKYAKDNDELKARIADLPPWQPDYVPGAEEQDTFGTEDKIAVYEGWQEGINGYDKGKHVVALAEDCVLIDEEWTTPVPIVSMHWIEGLRSVSDSAPLGRQIAPLMAIENQGHMKVQDAIAGSVVLVKGRADPKLSDVNYQFIKEDPNDPDIGTVTVEVPKVVSEDVRNHIKDVKDTITRLTGISEQAQTGDPPPQYKSGVALEAYIGILNKRLSNQHHAYKAMYDLSARIQITRGPFVWKDSGKVAEADGTDVIAQISWADVRMPEDAYRISFDAISDLPNHIPNKAELFQIAKDLGLRDAIDLIANLNTPDFQREAQRIAAPKNYIEFQISQALDDGVIEPPNDMQDRAEVAKRASEAWQSARCSKVKPPRAHMDALLVFWHLAAAQPGPEAPAPAGPTTPAAEAGAITPTPTETPESQPATL